MFAAMVGRALILLGFFVAACSGSGKKPVDAFYSTCGQPGDTGNELGVGKFCMTFSDCSGNASAPLCSNIGDATTFFCTKTCTSTGSAGQCGTMAQCECNAGNQCGCTPNACIH